MMKSQFTLRLFVMGLSVSMFLLSSCSAVAGFSSTPTPVPTSTPVPTPTLGLDEKVGKTIGVALPEGDVDYGKQLAIKWTCLGCHVANTAGPDFTSEFVAPAVIVRAELRLADPNYSGSATTPEEYVIESILLPENYLVEGEWKKAMPDHYGELLTVNDLASIMAYLHVLE